MEIKIGTKEMKKLAILRLAAFFCGVVSINALMWLDVGPTQLVFQCTAIASMFVVGMVAEKYGEAWGRNRTAMDIVSAQQRGEEVTAEFEEEREPCRGNAG